MVAKDEEGRKMQKKRLAEKKPKEEEKKDDVIVIGKRKRSVARAVLKKGSGKIAVNSIPLDSFPNEIAAMKMKEAVAIAGAEAANFDIEIRVSGGGYMSQADAARQAIAKGLSEMIGGDLKSRYLSYDRTLIVADTRRTEPHKPSRSSKGARRHKQRSKR